MDVNGHSGNGVPTFQTILPKGGDSNAPQDRVEKQREADTMEGEYQPPELKHTKTISGV
jgi:hypothetical protein